MSKKESNPPPPVNSKRPDPSPTPPSGCRAAKHSHHEIARLMYRYEVDNGVGGLSSGISADFATEVAMQYAEWFAKNN